MNKNRFEEHELPYQTLEKYGLTREMIEESLAYLDKKDSLYDENTKKGALWIYATNAPF